MKRLLLLLFAFVAVAAAQLSPEEQLEYFINRQTREFNLTVDDVRKCINTTQTKEEDMIYAADMSNDGVSRLKKVSCLKACLAEKQGTIVGRKIIVPKVMEDYARTEQNVTPEDKNRFRKSLEVCNEEVTATDDCEAVVLLGTCVMNKNRRP